MMKKTFLAACMALPLSACGADHVETVKNTAIEGMGEQTYGSILDNRTVCTNPQWSETEDSSGTTIVEYRCTLEGGVAWMQNERDDVIEDLRNQHEEYLQRHKESIERYQLGVDRARAKLAEMEQTGASRSAIIGQGQTLKVAEDFLDMNMDTHNNIVAGHQEEIAEANSIYDVTSVVEIYTWQVREDAPELTAAELVMVKESGEGKRRDYKTYQESDLFDVVAENDMEKVEGAVDIDTYLLQLQMDNLVM
ncbi:hypothetical protein [Halomonas maura]|uniref:hypothetical protein n=1 Tax=Halomonas maura TaxID=117606 RepID=UPI0025B47013|nr:hypothetical protein [Halomonas maura]MDN3555219.1 hypothetical protein [Halomonas maura]